ncbi:MAG: aminotransferase [Planctomycetota bacterium]|nr:MAG: aminotransferase [Planctomycetota bacterium]
MHKRLFIPGPVEVSKDVLEAMATPMIGHRSPEFSELYNRVIPKVKKILYTDQHVFLASSSATGMMEGSIRNLVKGRVLVACNGAFSDRWHEIAVNCGKEADQLKVDWGRAITADMVDEALSTGKYDAFTFTHNETSTGVMSPLEEVAEVLKKYPDVSFLIDAVSCMAGVKIEVDRLGIDCVLAGTQKAWGMPPGLTVFTVSEKAMEKAKTVEGKGSYFNFELFLKYHEKGQTPNTPAISLIFALDHQCDKMLAEGLDRRFARHLEMAARCRAWAKERGFKLFAEENYESVTLTCVENTRGIDVNALNDFLATKGVVISNGYGKRLKGKTFRIAHMGDCTLGELEEVLGYIDEFLNK